MTEERQFNRENYLEDFRSSIDHWEEQQLSRISQAMREILEEACGAENVRSQALSLLTKEDWILLRSLIQEYLESRGQFPESLKILLLYLASESWESFFGATHIALCTECDIEEDSARSLISDTQERVLQLLPNLLPAHALQNIALHIPRKSASLLTAEMKHIQDKALAARKALAAWGEA